MPKEEVAQIRAASSLKTSTNLQEKTNRRGVNPYQQQLKNDLDEQLKQENVPINVNFKNETKVSNHYQVKFFEYIQ